MQRGYLLLTFLIALSLAACKSEQKKMYDAKVSALLYYEREYRYGFPNETQQPEHGFTISTRSSQTEIEAYQRKYRDSIFLMLNELESMDLTPGRRSDTYLRKADLYYEMGDYPQAIEALEYVDRSLPFVQMKDILINKLKVKEAQKNGDSLALDSFYRVILKDYKAHYDYIEPALKVIFRLKNSDKVFYSEANTIVVEMFHYVMLLEGKERVLEQIDSLQISTKGNKEYFDRLKDLFAKGNYQILFE